MTVWEIFNGSAYLNAVKGDIETFSIHKDFVTFRNF